MGVKILLINKKIYKGEKVADLIVESSNKLKSINCPSKFTSSTIDEFLLLFLVAQKLREFLTLRIYLNLIRKKVQD